MTVLLDLFMSCVWHTLRPCVVDQIYKYYDFCFIYARLHHVSQAIYLAIYGLCSATHAAVYVIWFHGAPQFIPGKKLDVRC